MKEDHHSGVYFGTVVHNRLRPKKHRLSYKVFSLFLDLDNLPHLNRTLRFFSHNRFNVLSLRNADHGDNTGQSLSDYARQTCRAAGITTPIARVRLLFYPRMWGYAFNPLAIYYCYDEHERIAGLIYEVTNTFGERHSYVLNANSESSVLRHQCPKQFYVSPFMPMDCAYRFRITAPDETISVAIRQSDKDGPLMNAAFVGTREPLNDRTLARAVLKHPLMTLKVIAGIHWEALKLWRKGVPLVPHPSPPAKPHTIIPVNVSEKTG